MGLKPTHGLVPYTGILGVDPAVDHCGPMTRDVDNNALLLEALAGRDGMDPRQPSSWRPVKYTRSAQGRRQGFTRGRGERGFGHRNAEAEVDERDYRFTSDDELSRPGHPMSRLLIHGARSQSPVVMLTLHQYRIIH